MNKVLLCLFILVLSSFQQNAPIKVLGFFSNERSSDGEHATGYVVQLWEYKGSLIGSVSYNEGLIGDQAEGMISNVVYTKANGDLSFISSLNGQHVTFKGRVAPAKLTGTFNWNNRADKNQILKSCCKDAFIYKDYKSYKDWQNRLE